VLVRELASAVQVHAPEVGVDPVDASALAVDRLSGQRLDHVEGRPGEVAAERHVDEVRPKHELVVVVDDVEIDATGQACLEQEGGLQPGHAGTQHDDTRRWRAHVVSIRPSRVTTRHTNRVIRDERARRSSATVHGNHMKCVTTGHVPSRDAPLQDLTSRGGITWTTPSSFSVSPISLGRVRRCTT
jgi:hypothetical protein